MGNFEGGGVEGMGWILRVGDFEGLGGGGVGGQL